MIAQSNLGYITTTLQDLKTHVQDRITPVEINGEMKYIGFISLGNELIRAKVLCEMNQSFEKMFSNLEQKVLKYVRKQHLDPQWIKVDYVKNVEEIPFAQLEGEIAKTRSNYFRYGISFDANFNVAFLEQEINGNALIRKIKHEKMALHDNNINHYLKQKNSNTLLFMKRVYQDKNVYIFDTSSFFKNRDEAGISELYEGKLTNGLRKVANIKEEVHHLIEKSTNFLTSQVKDSGEFTYGYFSAFGKSIANYNILRHSSSLYSMAEGYEITQNPDTLAAVERGLKYLIATAIVYKREGEGGIAFVVEHANGGEIKLGSNATAILAMTKYMAVTGDMRYVKLAQALARGILDMKLPDSSFIHVLNYPDFSIKELNRIIYYEGEAIFALLRLYAIDREDRWLEEVKDSFAYFIKNDYWKHHDHWLSYAANELIIYEPEDKYFIFSMKNCQDRLGFIYKRETTFPTFLELTMAVYKMMKRLRALHKEHLLAYIDEDLLRETIDRRADFQRVGFFYPEQAMYMKRPGLILNGFFIRHHSFRVRIDDVEHYLSGYCQYYHERIVDMKQLEPEELDV